MRKLFSLLSLLFTHCFLCGESFVFMTPIKEGKAERLRSSDLLYSNEETKLFNSIEIEKYQRWIQTLRGKDLLIHHLEANNIRLALSKLKYKIDAKDSTALKLHNLYKAALGFDMESKSPLPCMRKVSDLMHVKIPHADQSLSKEYCFVYPLLPGKESQLFEMYSDKSVYFSDQVQEILRFRGISKMQIWVEKVDGRNFMVIYQEIVGCVKDAREKYLESKAEEFSKNRSAQYSEITGLAYEELLPNLESLFDDEVLN